MARKMVDGEGDEEGGRIWREGETEIAEGVEIER
jgi:hypothetical protein